MRELMGPEKSIFTIKKKVCKNLKSNNPIKFYRPILFNQLHVGVGIITKLPNSHGEDCF